MHVIEDNGTLKFYEGEKELTPHEGFKRLSDLYSTEPSEVRNIIDSLREKYYNLIGE